MKQNPSEKAPDIGDNTDPIPFTARLIAYYRAQETKSAAPLILDPLAELLAGDLSSYAAKHKRTAGSRDYAIVRSFYIEKMILTPWCNTHTQSQIVLLGAGLDTRAYRLEALRKHSHSVFEVDLPVINQYKESILRDIQPLCPLVRVSADLSNPEWPAHLLAHGYSDAIPTMWIMEGLVYYIEQDAVANLLGMARQMSANRSEIFVDIAIPGLTEAQYGAFMKHFKWGLALEQAPSFFRQLGWHVDCSFADDHDQGRDVGQRGLIFVHGYKGSIQEPDAEILEQEIVTDLTPCEFAKSFAIEQIPEIEEISKVYANDSDQGYELYLAFLWKIKPAIRKIANDLQDSSLILRIAPRLQRVPSLLTPDAERRPPDEEAAHLAGVFRELLVLLYCASKNLQFLELRKTDFHRVAEKSRSLGIQGVISLARSLELELTRF